VAGGNCILERILQCVTGGNCILERILQCVAVCCSALQCVAVCCSVLQCVAVCFLLPQEGYPSFFECFLNALLNFKDNYILLRMHI